MPVRVTVLPKRSIFSCSVLEDQPMALLDPGWLSGLSLDALGPKKLQAFSRSALGPTWCTLSIASMFDECFPPQPILSRTQPSRRFVDIPGVAISNLFSKTARSGFLPSQHFDSFQRRRKRDVTLSGLLDSLAGALRKHQHRRVCVDEGIVQPSPRIRRGEEESGTAPAAWDQT